ncbi:MAG: TIM-barrel domain-containing protein [Candidatus Sericytochromatia bacterium]|nr:TIM-barrel domain-containing protein [Candidatus Sericytochromatia bacterium]
MKQIVCGFAIGVGVWGVACPAEAAIVSWSRMTPNGYRLLVDASGAWAISAPGGKRLLSSSEAPWQVGFGRTQATHFFGTFRFAVPEPRWQALPAGPVRLERTRDGALRVQLGAPDQPGAVRLRFQASGPSGFRIEADACDARATRLQARLRRDPALPLYGFGARTNACTQAGRLVENWVQEGGNGKSERPFFGVSNFPTASHVPVPFCLSPAGFGLAIDGAERSVWDVGTQRAEQLGAEIDSGHLALTIDVAPEPAQVLAAYTARVGRPHMPPEWAFAPTEWGKGGSQAVREKARLLRQHGVPASALWFEDWVGLETGPLPGLTHLPWGRWVPDERHYSELASLNRELETAGFKSLGYFNPFLSQADPHAQLPLNSGYALRDPEGRPQFSLGPYGWLGHLDPTHAGARQWAFDRLTDFARQGFDGAMVDFGEWVPPDARFADGSTGWAQHNRYPDLWAALHRSFWERARPDGDFLFYTRAGWTAAARQATYMWAGDQNTDWGEDDGFPTALRAILSAGLSGIPLMTHDVAGFATLGERGVTKELYSRWVAFGAFSTFMRSHSGQKPSRNWHIFSDAETTALHRRYARAHMDLLPYRQAVVRQAVETGLPAMRHLMLAFPEDRTARGIDDAYMLGPDLLVAPIFTEGARERQVWLPEGSWYDWWSGRRVSGGQWLRVPAPLDALPVFARAGAILPLLPPGIMTTLPSADPAVPGREAYANQRVLRVFAGPSQSFALADGVTVTSRTPRSRAEQPLVPLRAFVQGRRVALLRVGSERLVRFTARAGQPVYVRFETEAGPWTLHWRERKDHDRQVTLRLVT